MRPSSHPRRSARAAALVVAAAVAAGAAPRPPAPAVEARALAQDGKRCTLTFSRDHLSERVPVSRVAWGGEVTVDLSVDVDCDLSLAPLMGAVTVTETLPAGLTLRPLDPPAAAWRADQAVWRFEPAADDLPGLVDRRIRYRLRAAPPDPAVTNAGELRLAWPLTADVALDTTRRPLSSGPDVPLTVVVSRPDQDCRLEATRRYTPAVARPGERIEVALDLTPHGCWVFPITRHGIIALQPPPALTAESVERSITTSRAWYDPPGGADGLYGLVWNVAPQPVVVPPTRDYERHAEPIRAWGGEPGGDAAAALRAALDAITAQPLAHEIVYYVGNAAAPRAAARALAAVTADAAARGVEIVPICVGGGCDPGLTWRYAFPDLQRLRDAILLDKLIDAHAGAAASLTSIALDEPLPPGARLVAGSVRTSAPGAVAVEAGRLRLGPLPAAVGVPLTVRYAVTAAPPAGAGYVGDGTAQLVYNDAFASARLRLPRAPLTVIDPRPGETACLPAAAKTAWEPSVVLGQTVDVTVAFDTVCPQDRRKQDLLIVVDGAVTTSATELSAIRGAVRTLLAGMGDTDLHAGLVAVDWQVRRVPLSAHLDRVLDAVDGLGDLEGKGFGEPNVAAGLAAALDELAWRRADAHAGVIVISPGFAPPEATRRAGERLRADGAQVATVCLDEVCDPVLQQVATDPADAHRTAPAALDDLLAALARRYGGVRIASATIEEMLPPDIDYVDGSAVPPPAVVDGRRLRWAVTAEPGRADARVRYAVRPRRAGAAQPLGAPTRLDVTDDRGRSNGTLLAPPAVTVFEAGETGPCRPDLERTPRRAAAVAGDPVVFTLAAALTCPPVPVVLDVVLVLDHSDSMASQDRLVNAVRAAHGFLDAVPPDTRVGLVAFGTAVTVRLPLDADRAAVRAALDGLTATGRTAIAQALVAAESMLADRRPDATGAVVLLTDGREAAGAVTAMLQAAARIKAAGHRIVTVCAGDCDPELVSVASSPDDALRTPDSAALVGIFAALAAELGRAQATDVRITEGYFEDVAPDPGAFIPSPAVRQAAEAVWAFGRLPRDRPQLVRVVVVPRSTARRESVRFTRLDYRFGREAGHAYFPNGFLDTVDPTPTAVPTWTPTPTRAPTRTPPPTATPPPWPAAGARVLWLPRLERDSRPASGSP